jgi:hypothetical protein
MRIYHHGRSDGTSITRKRAHNSGGASSDPNLTRSALHRCFKRHDISRLPDIAGDKPTKKFKQYPIGYFHIDIAEVRTEEDKLYLFVAIDRVCKFAFAELHAEANTMVAAVPYKIHTVLTDNRIQCTNRQRDRFAFVHIFDPFAMHIGSSTGLPGSIIPGLTAKWSA